ncbi:MAG: hypothetical protein KR126chlam6_00545 [Candidatus Anoxychlamydiales bacterium]|nr:hypothetical protein [Candidatus Anoxychlamydiales bacterium]
MKLLYSEDLQFLAIGSAILGSGGGGDPKYESLIADYLLKKNGPVKIISIDDLKDDDLILPIEIMGAPLITKEKIFSQKEFEAIINEIKKIYKNRNIILMAGEIGGANAFIPIIAGSILNLPILDGDSLGRAFPELQMSSMNLNNVSPSPSIIADSFGNIKVIMKKSASALEKEARQITITMGSSAAICFYIMDGKTAKKSIIKNTLSKAIKIGKIVSKLKLKNFDIFKYFEQKLNAKIIVKGIVVDVNQKVKDGFLQGDVIISDEDEKYTIHYQNENLICKKKSKVIVSTPDIISILDAQSFEAITSESLKFGQRVIVIAMPSEKIWQTKKGLKLVGPKVFGYDIEYKPILKRIVL